MTRAVFLCALLMAGAVAAAQNAAGAHAKFAQLTEQIKAAHHSGNAREVLSRSLELADLLHHTGPATEQVAMAYAGLGERRQALEWLRKFAAMGQSDEALASRPQFEYLNSLPEFKRVLGQMRENESRVDRAADVIRLSDAGLVPEDMDYDATTHSFLVTSVLEKKIVRVGLDGRTKAFAQSPDRWPMLAIRIDGRRDVVWATEVALKGFASVPSKDGGRSALVCMRLATGSLIRKIDVPHSALGDMALMPDGDVIVSDGENGGVYRARAGCTDPHLQRIDSGQFISPQTPAPLPDGVHVFIADYVRGVALLDVATGQTHWLDGHGRYAMQGIDGMYLVSNGLLAVQNGTSPERVAWFGLTGKGQVADEKVIDRSGPSLGDPTHGVLVGNAFYYIANSGWSSLDDEGRVKPGVRMTPAVIKKVPIADLGDLHTKLVLPSVWPGVGITSMSPR